MIDYWLSTFNGLALLDKKGGQMIPLGFSFFRKVMKAQYVLLSLLIALTGVAYGQTDKISELINKLNDPENQIRVEAAFDLGQTRDARAVEPLIKALKNDPDPKVREAATEGLKRAQDPRPVLGPLVDALEDKDERVRAYAALALGHLKDLRSVEPLIGLLSSPKAGFRAGAEIALGPMCDQRAIGPMEKNLNDPDENVRFEANQNLQKLKYNCSN